MHLLFNNGLWIFVSIHFPLRYVVHLTFLLTVLVSVSVNAFDIWKTTLNDNQLPCSDVLEVKILPLHSDQPKHPEFDFTFPVHELDDESTIHKCARFTNTRRWTSRKCKTTRLPEVQNGSVRCSCSRGSKFAVLKVIMPISSYFSLLFWRKYS